MVAPKIIIVSVICLFIMNSQAQFSGFFGAKEFSKDISHYKAKEFLINEVLLGSKKEVKFEIDALEAASSGELTTLVYKCTDLQKEGLVLGFYGQSWNENGVIYNGYRFKNIPSEKAFDLLKILDSLTSLHMKYIQTNTQTNNVYFMFDDLKFIFYATNSKLIIRVFWGGFDSEWNWSEIDKTMKRLSKMLKR